MLSFNIPLSPTFLPAALPTRKIIQWCIHPDPYLILKCSQFFCFLQMLEIVLNCFATHFAHTYSPLAFPVVISDLSSTKYIWFLMVSNPAGRERHLCRLTLCSSLPHSTELTYCSFMGWKLWIANICIHACWHWDATDAPPLYSAQCILIKKLVNVNSKR